MRVLPFVKLQSVGNDFPLLRTSDLLLRFGSALEEALPALAEAICDRRFGVGGDGLLTLGEESDGALRMRMFNPDGTEDFCGNGLRCAARFAAGDGPARKVLRHLHVEVPTEVLEDGRIRTTLGAPSYDPKRVPLRPGLGEIYDRPLFEDLGLSVRGSSLTTGSTHTVLQVPELPDDEAFVRWSRAIETHPDYPHRTSVIWVQEVEPMALRVRIWERGVGETLGCGTGTSAAAADYVRRKGTPGLVRVENPGGLLSVHIEAWDAPLVLEGTAQEVFRGEYRLPERFLPWLQTLIA